VAGSCISRLVRARHTSRSYHATDVLAFTGFPKEHLRQVWSNNPQERLNERSHVEHPSRRVSPNHRTSQDGPKLES